MSNDRIKELIERIEKESGASTELNADIWLATRVKWSASQYSHWVGYQPKCEPRTERQYALDRAPNFSGSLDTAMTLFPPAHHLVELREIWTNQWFASVAAIDSDSGDVFEANAETGPLALAAAALRAIASQPHKDAGR